MMDRKMLFTAALLVAAVLLSAGAPAVEDRRQYLYQWTDDQGNTAIVDSLEKVPPKYRSKARALEQGGAAAPAPASGSPEAPAIPAGEAADRQQQSEDAKKAEWQQRVLVAKRQLAAAEERYQQLEAAKADIMSKWGASGSALPPQEVINQINQLTADMEKTRREIEKWKNDINVVIPDEARRADVPPGWIREVQ
jgi:hypothetical protein